MRHHVDDVVGVGHQSVKQVSQRKLRGNIKGLDLDDP